MRIRELRTQLGMTQSEFATRYHIPFRTVQNWESDVRRPPGLCSETVESRIQSDLVNRKTAVLPKYDPQKQNLPKRSDFIGATAWLKGVLNCIGEPIVFALDEALMCQNLSAGAVTNSLSFIYGSDHTTRFNRRRCAGKSHQSDECAATQWPFLHRFQPHNLGCSGKRIPARYAGNHRGNQPLLLCPWRKFEGISVAPEYQERFEKLANDAIHYYSKLR